MPERQRGEVPEAAVEAQLRDGVLAALLPDSEGWDDFWREQVIRAVLEAAQAPALGDQRLVPLADVLEAVECWQRADESVKTEAEFADLGVFLARTFGGEADER